MLNWDSEKSLVKKLSMFFLALSRERPQVSLLVKLGQNLKKDLNPQMVDDLFLFFPNPRSPLSTGGSTIRQWWLRCHMFN